MGYNPELPNKFDSGLIPEKIRSRYFEEYLGLTPLSVFMGTGMNDAIQVFEMKAGEGMTYTVPFRKEMNYENPIEGYNQAIGAAQQVEIYQDEIKLKFLRFVNGLMGKVLVKQMTPVEVYESLRPLLLNAQKRALVKSILDSATADLYDPTAQGPVNDRVVYANGTYKGNINEAVATMGDPTYDKSGLSVNHIRQLKALAVAGGHSFEKEARIRPIELSTKKGFPEEMYVYLMDSASYLSLCKDPEWSQQVTRGIMQNKDQPEGLSGARYRGTIEGVMIYEAQELGRYQVGDGTVAWNLFLGAQAFGLCFGKRPWFEMEETDFKLNVEMASCEIRGQKALMFPSFQDSNKTVERGIIHSFVKIK